MSEAGDRLGAEGGTGDKPAMELLDRVIQSRRFGRGGILTPDFDPMPDGAKEFGRVGFGAEMDEGKLGVPESLRVQGCHAGGFGLVAANELRFEFRLPRMGEVSSLEVLADPAAVAGESGDPPNGGAGRVPELDQTEAASLSAQPGLAPQLSQWFGLARHVRGMWQIQWQFNRRLQKIPE